MAVPTQQLIIPNPDPSAITSSAIEKAVTGARDIIDARIDGIEKAFAIFQEDMVRVPTQVDRSIGGLQSLIEARLTAMDKDTVYIHANLERRTLDIREQIIHLQDLLESQLEKISAVSVERFARIDTQFIERDKRTDQLSLADKTAVAAALQAAKEAVGAQNTSNSIAIAKSESSTVESIRQLQTLFNSAIAAVNDKLNDTRSRLDRGDGSSNGQTTANVEHRNNTADSRGLIFGVIGIGIAVAAIIVTITTHFMK